MRVLALLVVVACAHPAPLPDRADLVLVNGRIFTGGSWSDAVAIRGEHIVALGEDARRMIAGRRIELGGKLVIPGLHDAHVHAPTLFAAHEVDGDEGEDDSLTTLARIEQATREAAPGTWLHAVLGDPSIDSGLARDALDRVAPVHPVWIDNSTGHVVVMNSVAERLLDVPNNAARPGWHFEYERYRAMARRATVTDEDLAAAIATFEAQEIAWGVTSVTAFPLDVDADRLARGLHAGHRKLRWHVVRTPLDGVIVPPHSSTTDRVIVEGTKYFIDGMPTERGAALETPYEDAPTSGQLDFPLDAIEKMLAASRDTGDTLHLHAVGDRAIRTVLDAAERVPGAHLVIEHAHLISSKDIARAKRLGVSIVVTPFHGEQARINLRRLGARMRDWIPLAALVASGIHVALGSDGPDNPFRFIAAAIGYYELPRETALALATDTVQLAPGSVADLAVLDVNILKAESLDAHAVLTIVGGEIVYEAPAASPASVPTSARTE